MAKKNLLEGKSVLIVDDEPDILDTLEDLLDMCLVVKASSYEEAKKHLETQAFDLAIFDIMGVDGFRLLEIARGRNVLSIMLTANALNPANTVKAYEGGAASYVPKEEISGITYYLNEVLVARERGDHLWSGWLEKLGSSYDKKFGSGWRYKHKDFIERLEGQTKKD
jgi:DNA-binding NtrC family response regulator